MSTTADIIITSPAQIAKEAKELLTLKLKRYAHLESVIKAVTKEQQDKILAITQATTETLQPHRDEKARLKAEIEAVATHNRMPLFGPKSKTLDMVTHALSFRASQAVECDNEAEVIATLEETVDNPDTSEAHRIAAAACLRYEAPTLDKGFIKKHWRKHRRWFAEYFGFSIKTRETFTIKAKDEPDLEEA